MKLVTEVQRPLHASPGKNRRSNKTYIVSGSGPADSYLLADLNMRRDIFKHNVVVTVVLRIAEEGGGQEEDGNAQFHCGGT